MSEIDIVHAVDDDELAARGVQDWPVWAKSVSMFPWTYENSETCYFLEGEAVVTPSGGEPIYVGKGDLVTFPAGMSCVWDVRSAVRKHFVFS